MYFNAPSSGMKYVMDASYWVYIMHLPVVAFIPGVLAGFAIPSLVKFGITISVTAVICFGTYRYFVRGKLIERFLNGKIYLEKYPESQPPKVLRSSE